MFAVHEIPFIAAGQIPRLRSVVSKRPQFFFATARDGMLLGWAMSRRPTMSKGGCEASLARMCSDGVTLKTRMCHSEGELDGEAEGSALRVLRFTGLL
jgi:hypothetical protein